ncbi:MULTISPECIES: RHS repeat-associated core domain-containing protein [unclassified Nocardiopsis]|uniref:RHS repeat-associated core domain-containing protein n=1 Tax=unclassified Nocardiopsis TaxID=2649073 RepID=UPI001F2AF3E3|nr:MULTISPECIES: RHS repeat-associated core domain-containing protein [unclassified Nocardiopsis]
MRPFGFACAYRFQGRTTNLGHRFYDTNTLNFTQPDPSRQEMNLYVYAMGNPVNNTDPLGLMTEAEAGATIEAGLAGVAAGALFGAGCMATVTCGAALVVIPAFWAAGGGAAGAAVAGGSQQEIEDGMWSGLATGAIGAPLGPYGTVWSAVSLTTSS